MPQYENKRLYVDIAEWDKETHYVKVNPELYDAVWDKVNLSLCEFRIFQYICMRYDGKPIGCLEPLKLSHGDIAEFAKCSFEGARKAVENLIKYELITVKRGKGRAKNEYQPNIEVLHALLKEYLKKHKLIE